MRKNIIAGVLTVSVMALVIGILTLFAANPLVGFGVLMMVAIPFFSYSIFNHIKSKL